VRRLVGWLAVATAAILITVGILSFSAGIFDKIEIAVTEFGPLTVLCRDHRGPYRDIRRDVRDVYRYLVEKRAILPQKGFAEFFDDPQKTREQDLRSIGGYCTDSLLANVPPPYSARVIPRSQCIVGTFPLRSFLSAMIGPMKFYSGVLKTLERETAGPAIEIYDVPAKKIVYAMPLK